MLASQALISKKRRQVRHVRLADFDLLALANEDVGRQIVLFGSFEPDETHYFKTIIRPEDVCFDIGGNVGFFSMLMAKCASRGKVHVFEPIPLNAALIGANAALNHFGNLQINNVAVGSEKGSLPFSVSVDSAYSSLHPTDRIAEENTITVPVVTIDGYIAEQGIARVDIMKVDVEGAEDMVIRGAERLLSDPARRPRSVLLELFDINLKPFDSNVLAVVARMVEFGYAAKVLTPGGTDLVPFTPDMANQYYNVIFVA